METADTAVCENSTAGIAISATEANLGMGQIVLGGRNQQNVNRKRLKELFALAYETVEWLEKKGLKKGEQCEFREIAERLWWKD